MTDICCIGHIARDRIIKETAPKIVDCAGGSAYYVAWALQALPHHMDIQLITSVNPVMMAEVERLREAGIPVIVYMSPDNVFFENKYDGDMDHCVQRVLAKSAPFTIQQLEGIEAKVFHLGTLLADDFAPEIVEFLAKKGDVCIDVQGYLRTIRDEKVYPMEWTDKLRLLKQTAILKANEWESQTLTGFADPYQAAEQIHDWGVREVLITLGSNGSVIYADGHFYDIPAYPPSQLIDATGCGDTYCAGYLYARANGMDYAESGRFAAAMCTLKLEHTGPFDRTIDDVRRILNP